MTRSDFGLLLFSTDDEQVRMAVDCGVSAVVVDWERVGKHARQRGADTQIGVDTLDDLRRVRRATRGTVICRINAAGHRPPGEIDSAIAAGADELLIPMVRSISDITEVLDEVDGRVGVGVLVETIDALRVAAEINQLPLRRVYVGLNDLCIEMGSDSIFSPLASGLMPQIRACFSLPFGFGGLTLPSAGHPIPCRLLIGEMVRLSCQFSFLRRSFRRDAGDQPLAMPVRQVLEGLEVARRRSPSEVEDDRLQLECTIRALERRDTGVAS